jgi:thiol-disulfide isomerase/thioredoxin
MQRMAVGNRRTAPRRARRRGFIGGAAALALGGIWPWRGAEAAHTVRPWPSDRPAPPLDLVDLEGKRWRLEATVGNVVVLNFWATWCKPCRIEMPSLAAMAEQRRGDGVVVVAVNYLEAAEKIRRYLDGAPFKPPILLDSEGDATVAWTPRVFPSTVLIGRNGRPVQTVVGELDWRGAEAERLLEPLVAARRKA